jgi:two-component system sensor histidine kinase KdpD
VARQDGLHDELVLVDQAPIASPGCSSNLLDLSRIQLGALAPAITVVPIADVLHSAVAPLGPPGRTVVVSAVSGQPCVAVDVGLVERAIANIIANAVAWSPPNARVHLEARRSSDRVAVRVIDHGPGIAPADRERVFAPFDRVDRPGDTRASIGLGLAVARSFVRAVHGDVTIEDTPGGGATFVVDLPIASSSAPLGSVDIPIRD